MRKLSILKTTVIIGLLSMSSLAWGDANEKELLLTCYEASTNDLVIEIYGDRLTSEVDSSIILISETPHEATAIGSDIYIFNENLFVSGESYPNFSYELSHIKITGWNSFLGSLKIKSPDSTSMNVNCNNF